ncbi:MAG: hypothetical protein D6713_06490 [Deltaproteobacteria bacterium]|nr:MAG: hypothetical protein D6713_06490 [Deltaproteobacteria bacterium]
MKDFLGYHSEWNLGSPGGWDYQRITQVIGKAVWEKVLEQCDPGVPLDFDHPLLYPINNFVDMLLDALRQREGSAGGFVAVMAEEETLEDVVENINLAERLNSIDGVESALMAPQELELRNGHVTYRGRRVSLIFMDFNTDTLLKLHRKHDLTPLVEAVKRNLVINPRGTEPINVKSVFELITGGERGRFTEETVRRTPWTRRFFPRKTEGPSGEKISDLVEWTRENWERLVLKPERGYSGIGVRVGGIHGDADEAVETALREGGYIVQEKIPLSLWAEEMPEFDREEGRVHLKVFQTDFRCLMGPGGLHGFLVRYGGVPTNVGSGGGVQPLAILRGEIPVREAVKRLNDAVMNLPASLLEEIVAYQESLALQHRFTYLLGPIKIALRPRLITEEHVEALKRYVSSVWKDCITLERMWEEGLLDDFVSLDPEEVEIARSQPWRGSHAVFATDGLFSFGAHPEEWDGEESGP